MKIGKRWIILTGIVAFVLISSFVISVGAYGCDGAEWLAPAAQKAIGCE